MQDHSRYREIKRIAKGLFLVADSRSYRMLVRKDVDMAAYKRELVLYQELSHQAFPQLCDAWTDSRGGHLVISFFHGPTLEERLKKEGPLPERALIEKARQICSALEHLHTMRPPAVYLDLKPSNLIDGEGGVHIIDLGSAARLWAAPEDAEGAAGESGTSGAVDRTARKHTYSAVDRAVRKHTYGTVGYAPPEQLRGEISVSADVYALGMCMRRMMRGYRGGKRKRRRYSAGLRRITRKATRRDPSARYSSMAEMKAALLHTEPAQRADVLERALLALFAAVFSIVAVSNLFDRHDTRAAKQASIGLSAGALAEKAEGDAVRARREGLFSHLLVYGSDFALPDGELEQILREAEKDIAQRLADGADERECLSDYQQLCRIYTLRENETGEEAALRIPEIARSALYLIHDMRASGRVDQQLGELESYFLQCLIVRLEDSGREEDILLARDYRQRLAAIEEERGQHEEQKECRGKSQV